VFLKFVLWLKNDWDGNEVSLGFRDRRPTVTVRAEKTLRDKYTYTYNDISCGEQLQRVRGIIIMIECSGNGFSTNLYRAHKFDCLEHDLVINVYAALFW